MKPYTPLLLLAAVVGGLSVLFRLFSRTDDPLVAGLASLLLSPAASIVLPSAPLFANLTRRCIDVFTPDIAAVVRVGTEADITLIVRNPTPSRASILTTAPDFIRETK